MSLVSSTTSRSGGFDITPPRDARAPVSEWAESCRESQADRRTGRLLTWRIAFLGDNTPTDDGMEEYKSLQKRTSCQGVFEDNPDTCLRQYADDVDKNPHPEHAPHIKQHQRQDLTDSSH
ncbi:hypothetical protein Bbelb_337250 [Branchiostoma belcheri]|nr:hypothetical protein Bbelb_337250 [Branchiostoma belcheri]